MSNDTTNDIKQTADTLLFKRYSKDEIIPEGQRIAFKDQFGNRYVLKLRRYFIIDELDEYDAEKFIGKRIYDYYDDNGKIEDYDSLVNILRTSYDFSELYENHVDYINCIIVRSVSDTGNDAKAIDLLDEDLFMSYQENGIFSRYLNIKPNRKIKHVLNNSCYVNLIVKKFQTAFLNSKYKFELTAESLCELCGIEYKNENIGLSIRKSIAFFEKFKLGLCVYGPFGCLMFKYKCKPMRRNKNINTSCLYMYIHNNHCYEINDNVKNCAVPYLQHYFSIFQFTLVT